jgi:hypothetical protein
MAKKSANGLVAVQFGGCDGNMVQCLTTFFMPDAAAVSLVLGLRVILRVARLPDRCAGRVSLDRRPRANR